MPKLDLSTSVEKLTVKVIDRLPPSLKKHAARLTPQQQQTAVLATGGATGFFVLWLLFGMLFGSNDPFLDQQAFAPQQSAGQNTPTAITKTSQAFPKDTAAPAKPAVTAAETVLDIKPVTLLTKEQELQIARLRENVEYQYKSALPFVLNETKMISFALAASRIDKVNMRWDTLIAGAPDQVLAIEYLSSAQIEIKQLLQNTIGINANEYNAIFALSTHDEKFNEIANAYKNLVAQGIWGPVSPAIILPPPQLKQPQFPNGQPVQPSLRFPVAPPVVEKTPVVNEKSVSASPAITSAPVTTPAAPANPVAAPAVQNTAPAPAGSPTPPYSPQPAR